MYVLSVSSKRFRALAVIAAVLVITAVIVSLVFSGSGKEKAAEKESGALRYKAGSASERLSFISQFGWQVDEEPAEVQEILIPAEFDDVYLNYNKIQLSQGLDLKNYAGFRVKRWTYTVQNYPGTESSDTYIRINLLICDGQVVGGDVCSTALDGFMHGFNAPDGTFADAPSEAETLEETYGTTRTPG